MTMAAKTLPRLMSFQDRILFASYMRHVVIVLVMLTTIAVALDTASWINRVGAGAAASGNSPALAILKFLALRIFDNGTQTLPIAAILGFIWTEVAYHQSGHRLIDRITGRTEWRAMRAIFLAGLAVAVVQTVLDNVVRPQAVRTMITERIAYWSRYTEFRPNSTVWISAGGSILEGRAGDIGTSELRDVTYYDFDGNRISRIVRAPVLRPAPKPGPGGVRDWRFETPSVFLLSTAATGAQSGAMVSSEELAELTVPLKLDPEWLPLASIRPIYLSLPDLARMARIDNLPDGSANYGSALLGRLTNGLIVGLLCVFIALFCRRRLDHGSLEAAVMFALAIGYGGVLAMRMLRVIGEHASFGPLAVGVVMPLFLKVAIVLNVRWNTRHDAVHRLHGGP